MGNENFEWEKWKIRKFDKRNERSEWCEENNHRLYVLTNRKFHFLQTIRMRRKKYKRFEMCWSRNKSRIKNFSDTFFDFELQMNFHFRFLNHILVFRVNWKSSRSKLVWNFSCQMCNCWRLHFIENNHIYSTRFTVKGVLVRFRLLHFAFITFRFS